MPYGSGSGGGPGTDFYGFFGLPKGRIFNGKISIKKSRVRAPRELQEATRAREINGSHRKPPRATESHTSHTNPMST